MRRLVNRNRPQAPARRPVAPAPAVPLPRPVIPPGHVRLVGCPHPLRSERIDLMVPAGESLFAIAREASLHSRAPEALMRHGYAWLDGEPVPFERWADVVPEPGQTVAFRMVPFGGGGGGGKNPMKTVMTLAMMVAANAAGQYWANATYLGGGFSTANASFLSSVGITAPMGLGSAMAAGAVMIGGNMIMNAMVPMNSAKGNQGSIGSSEKEDAVYSVSGISNQIAPWGEVPLALGFLRWAPKHGAKPYTEISGNDQFVKAILDWGGGPLKIYDLQIGDTLVTELSDCTVQTVEGFPSTDPTQDIYTDDIHEEQLSILLEHDDPQVRTTGAAADRFSVDLSFSSLCDYSGGTRQEHTVAVIVEYREHGSTGDWTATDGFSVTAESTQAVRKSLSITFPSRGQYDVRLTRTTPESNKDGIYEDAYWSVLRTITNQSPINVPYVNATSQLSVRGTGQLNGALDRLNGLTKTWCLDWDSDTETWIERETNNPASLYRYVLQSEFNPFPRTDGQIDLDGLADWHEFCVLMGYTYNKVCEGDEVEDILSEIAAAGRASRVMRDGKWGVVVDKARDVVAFDFTPVHIVGGVTVKRDLREAPHALRCPFLNEETWEEDELVVYGPGYDETNATIFEQWSAPGVNNAAQLFSLADYHLKVLYLRRETFLWNVDFAHLNCQRCDLVTVAHPVVGTGLSQGRVKAVTDNGGGSYTVATSEPCVMETGTDYAVLIRSIADGSRTVYPVTTVDGENWELTIPEAGTLVPAKGDIFSFGEEGKETKELLVTSIREGKDLSAEMTGVDYAPQVFTASEMPEWTANVTRSPWVSPSTPQAPTILMLTSDESVLVRDSDGTLAARIQVTYSLGSGAVMADEVRVQYKPSSADVWTSAPAVEAGDPAMVTGVEEGESYDLRIRTVNTTAGVASAWVTETGHTVVGKTANPSDVSVFTLAAADGGITATWGQVTDLDVAHYEIRDEDANWGDGSEIASSAGSTVPLPMAAAGSHTYYIRALDTTGHYSAASASASITVTAPSLTGLAADYLTASVRQGAVVQLTWTGVQASFAIAGYQVRRGTAWATATEMGQVDATRAQYPVDWGGTQTWWVAPVDAYGNVGSPVSVDAVVVLPSASALTLQVIDSSVLMRWTGTAGSLPIAGYNVYRGAVDDDHLIGTADATFKVQDEVASGTFQYFIEPVDAAGNTGSTASATTTVDEPPDFVLYAEFEGDFDTAILSNAYVMASGSLLLPVNTTETWAEHFTNARASSIQDMVDAGYTYWCEPNPSAASYQEDYDAGAVIAGCRIVADIDLTTIDDGVTVTPQIYTKEASGDAWTAQAAGQWEVYATEFRYVRLLVTFTASDDTSQAVVSGVTVSLRVKRAMDSGTVSITSHGQTVAFNNTYLDAEQPVVTPGGTTPLVAVVDFTDAPNPTGFDVYLFDTDGNAATLPVTIGWTTRGVIQGG